MKQGTCNHCDRPMDQLCCEGPCEDGPCNCRGSVKIFVSGDLARDGKMFSKRIRLGKCHCREELDSKVGIVRATLSACTSGLEVGGKANHA